MSLNTTLRRLSILALTALVACSPVGGQRYTRKVAQKSLAQLEQPGVVVGEFHITKIVDGDTVKVDGLDSSLRLLGDDTEETFKNEADRRAMEASWEDYKKAKRPGLRPGKYATPMGEQAKLFAKHFFEGVDKVRIERDHPAEIRDAYNRYLAYVIALKNGKWINYNIEVVRAGMSPYFSKYGYSRRYHKEFLAALEEAKAAHRGIWAPGAPGYPDYAEREAWWNARGEFIDQFHKEAEGNPSFIDITHWDALKQIEASVGKEVTILGVVGDVRIGEKGPTRVTLTRRMFSGFPLIFFDRDVLGTSGLAEWKGEPVRVTGIPTLYENKHTHKKEVQIVIDRASQITLSPVPGLTVPSAAPPAETPGK